MSTDITKIAVVIAAYNEGGKIAEVVAGVPRKLDKIGTIDVVVVDDGSADDTNQAARSAGAIVIRHPINRGQGSALKTGFTYAISHNYDVVVTFDADGQHRADEIGLLVHTLLEKKVDMVLGSRFLGKTVNLSSSRKFILKVGVLFTRILSRVKVTDTHNGFRAMRVSALSKMSLVQDRMEHASEIIDQINKKKLSFVEAPVTIEYSDYSTQKGQRNSAALKIAGKMIADKIIQ